MKPETIARETADVTRKVVREGEKLVRKAWSIMDAAVEKQQPGQVLSQETVRRIQGRS